MHLFTACYILNILNEPLFPIVTIEPPIYNATSPSISQIGNFESLELGIIFFLFLKCSKIKRIAFSLRDQFFLLIE